MTDALNDAGFVRDRDADLPEEMMWEGRFITAKKRGRWEYVGRARGIRAAAIVTIAEDPDGARHVILVGQYRVPLGRFCLEIPAGLVGDDAGGEGEAAIDAAARELEEETGYRAGKLEVLGEFYSSPGMVSEMFTLIKATDLTKVGDGGGVLIRDSFFVGGHVDLGIDAAEAFDSGLCLECADIAGVMEDLPLQIREVNAIEVDKTNFANSCGSQVHRNWRAEPPGSDTENPGGFEARLTFHPDIRYGEVTGVALLLCFGQICIRKAVRWNQRRHRKKRKNLDGTNRTLRSN